MQRFSHFFQCSKVCRSAFEESRELFKAMWWLLIPVQECFSCRVAWYSTAQDHEHALQHAAEERAHSLGLMCLCFYDTMRNFWISLPVRRSSIVGPNMTLLSWQTALISATTLAVWRLEISGSLERFEWALRPDTLLGALKDKMEGDLKASCKWCAPSESPFVIGLSAFRFCSFAVSFLLKWFQTLYVVVLCKLHRRSANSCHGVALQECVETAMGGPWFQTWAVRVDFAEFQGKVRRLSPCSSKMVFLFSRELKHQTTKRWLRFCHHYMLPHTSWLLEWPNVREWHMRRSSTRRLGHSGMKSMAFRAWGFVCPETSVAHGWKPS